MPETHVSMDIAANIQTGRTQGNRPAPFVFAVFNSASYNALRMAVTTNAAQRGQKRLKVAWISYFPIEWLDGVPAEVKNLRRLHPATWQQSLLVELENNPDINLHILVVRSTFERDLRFERNGVTFHLLKTRPGWRAPSLFWTDTVRIRKVLRKVQPDVVHAWGTENGAALVAQRLGYPNIVSIQGLLRWYKTLVPLSRYERLAAQIERFCLHRAPLVSAESADTVARVRAAYPRTRTLHIEHPPLKHFSTLDRQPDQSPIRLLSVGAMGYRKGSDLYLAALGQLIPELGFRCVALGKSDPAYLAQLRDNLPKELWPSFEFRHATTNEAVAQEYQRATIMVMPSRADTGPVAVKEAVAAGVPVVASEMGGVPEYIEPGRNGFICRPNDLADLVQKIRAACQHPLFSQGKVEETTLRQKQLLLDPQRATKLFVQAYQRAYEEQRHKQDLESVFTVNHQG